MAFRAVLLSLAISCTCAQAATAPRDDASSYPNKPIRLVVPSAPGGGTDIVARLIGQGLQDAWGQTVVVDNRGGAGGIPGVTMVAKHSAADGYTMLLGSNGHISFAPAVRPNLAFDPQKDLTPISMVAQQPFVWVVSPAVPVSNMKDFIAYAKGKPGALRYGSGGVGTASHLGTELLQLTGGIKLDHVPYKGTGPGMTALLGGEIQVLLVGLATVLPYVKTKSDRLKVLAVTSSKRAAVAPEIPTIAESALPGFQFDVWYGMVVPGGTPRAIVDKANTAIVKLLNTPVVRERFTAVGLEPSPSTAEEFRDLLRREIPTWHKVAKQANIRID
ncbi:MAG TPA: tripartite tricarboxylate transporter substrate binding protein [Burkholderiales bacterium]|nr:tripartite tricarboxylate transporter substrate binding protein [Burkholderiales bacterium]